MMAFRTSPQPEHQSKDLSPSSFANPSSTLYAPPLNISPSHYLNPWPSNTSTSTSTTPPPPNPLNKFSCTRCQSRKVKCNRLQPCNNCTKSNAECVFRAPPPPRRRKRIAGPEQENAELRDKVMKYEEMLRRLGVDPEDGEAGEGEGMNVDTLPAKSAGEVVENDGPATEKGKLIRDPGRSRYFDNNLWTSLSEELQTSNDVLQDPSDDEDNCQPVTTVAGALTTLNSSGIDLLLGVPIKSNLYLFHPKLEILLQLWEIFKENVDPIVKIFHIPTLDQQIKKMSANLSNLSKSSEALLFSIYCGTINSMSEKDCELVLGEPKSVAIQKYQAGARHALISARFLRSSNVQLLQSYVIFLLSARQYYDARSLWTLTGVAVRIGQRIGLHRDGSNLNLSIMETEMRRRLWWQIVLMDSRTAELAASGTSILAQLWDTKIPPNINDADLHPDMTEPPKEHEGPTEMIFCLMRYSLGDLFRKTITTTKAGNNLFQHPTNREGVLAGQHAKIDEVERAIEQNFLRYCDSLIGLHTHTLLVARTSIAVSRLLAHQPQRSAEMSSEQKDTIFNTSLKIIEYDNMGQATPGSQKYLWHSNNYFQWHALIYILTELKTRTKGPDAEKAWQQIEKVFEYHKDFITAKDKALYIAIGNLTLKVWAAREVPPSTTPPFITLLRH